MPIKKHAIIKVTASLQSVIAIALTLFSIVECQGSPCSEKMIFQSSPFSTSLDVNAIEIPKYLFIWMSPESLSALEDLSKKSRDSKLHFFPLSWNPKTGSMFAGTWPEFRDKEYSFGWSHPYAAMGFRENVTHDQASGEIYARFGKNGEPPRLLVLRIDPKAKYIVIYSEILPGTKSRRILKKYGDLSVGSYDLILHIHNQLDERTGEALSYREWIVNPNAVTAFSANPESLPEDVKMELDKVGQSGAELTQEEVFSSIPMDRKYRNRAVKAYLDSKGGAIPMMFRRSLDP